MMIAFAQLDSEQQLLVLGLSHANLDRLSQGEPVCISRETHGLAVPVGLKIMIFTGDTEDTMRDQLAGLFGPATVIDQRKAH